MRDNFERFGAMKLGINKPDWSGIALTMYNALRIICVGYEGIIVTERQQAHRSLADFVCTNLARSRSEMCVLLADGSVDQHILTHVFGLPNVHFMADHWHLFD